MQTITIDQLSEVKELTDADGIIVNQKNTSIANLGQIKEYIQEDLLDSAVEGVQDYIAQYMAGRNEWLPPVNTVVELKNKYTSANLDKKISYLCKVVADPVKSGVYQAVAGWTKNPTWALYDDTVDFVNEDELEAKVTELRTEIDEQKGTINGIATLDEEGKVPTTQIPTIDGGLLAVTSDDTLKGNGTNTDPLGLAGISLTAGSSDSSAPNAKTDTVKNIFQAIWNKLAWARTNVNNLSSTPKSLVGTVMYMTELNMEAKLAAQYGGTWERASTDSYRGSLFANLGMIEPDCRNYELNPIPVTPGVVNTIVISYSWTMTAVGIAELHSNTRGKLQSKPYDRCTLYFDGFIPNVGEIINLVPYSFFPHSPVACSPKIYKALDVYVYAYVRVV